MTMTQAHQTNNLLSYTDQGAGPAVVLLHGLFGSASNLGQTAKDLATDHRVISLDLPGHGRSAHWQDYSHESMADAILEALTPLALNSFHLLGHSLGGKIAMRLASQLNDPKVTTAAQPTTALNAPDSTTTVALPPPTVNKLVIVDIAPRHYPPHHNEIFQGLKGVPLGTNVNRREADLRLAEHINDAGIRAFLLKSFRPNKEGIRTWQFDLTQLEAQYAKLAQSPQLTQKIHSPTLFIKGANSDYLLPRDEAAIKASFTDPEFKIIHGTGHWPHAEKPSAFNRLVRRFLTRASNE